MARLEPRLGGHRVGRDVVVPAPAASGLPPGTDSLIVSGGSVSSRPLTMQRWRYPAPTGGTSRDGTIPKPAKTPEKSRQNHAHQQPMGWNRVPDEPNRLVPTAAEGTPMSDDSYDEVGTPAAPARPGWHLTEPG